MGKIMLKNVIKDLDLLYDYVINMDKSEVERKYGYKGQTLRNFLKRNGYDVKSFLEYKEDRQFILFLELYNKGYSIPEISKTIKLSNDTIYKSFKKNNINYHENNLKTQSGIDKHMSNLSFENIKRNYIDEEFVLFKDDCRYAISNYGRVYSFIINGFLKEYVEKDGKNKGYVRYNINNKHASKHRLVAIHFIDNPDNLPEVNHIDSDRENCKYSNLEWCDRGYNVKHALNNKENHKKAVERARMAGMKNAIKVLCIQDNIEFESISDCARYYGIKNSECISRVCKGKNKYAKDKNLRKLTFRIVGD